MENHWKTLSSRIAYETPWIKVQEDKVIRPDGKEGLYSFLKLGAAVFVVAVNDNDEVLLIGQYRYPIKAGSWEVVGGNADGEDPLTAAKRELEEEAGLKADRWEELGYFYESNGASDQTGHIYLARELKKCGFDKKAEEGIEEEKWIKFGDVTDLIGKGEITDGETIIALMKALLYLKKIGSGGAA